MRAPQYETTLLQELDCPSPGDWPVHHPAELRPLPDRLVIQAVFRHDVEHNSSAGAYYSGHLYQIARDRAEFEVDKDCVGMDEIYQPWLVCDSEWPSQSHTTTFGNNLGVRRPVSWQAHRSHTL